MILKHGFTHATCGLSRVWQTSGGVYVCDHCGIVFDSQLILVDVHAHAEATGFVAQATDGKKEGPPVFQLERRFYKGSDSLSKHLMEGRSAERSILRATAEEAIEDAKKALTDTPAQKVSFVVEIIKVVEREQPPFSVKDVV